MINKVLSSAFHRKEFRNYFHFLARNRKIIPFLNKSYQYLLSRLPRRYILPEYRQIINQIKSTYLIRTDSHPYKTIPFQVLANQCFKKEKSNIFKITLASQELCLDDQMPWQAKFYDQEDIYALHRFGWLLHIISSNISSLRIKKLENLIVNWIEKNPYKKNSSGWDSYSISERIVNWILFLSFLGSVGFTENCNKIGMILHSMQKQVEILIKNLEFRGSATNNHLINNGRALYLAGTYLQSPSACETGRCIINMTRHKMFSESGFLREGSSHYQILLARTFIEIIWFALAAKDERFLKDIYDFAQRVVFSAQYFMESSPIPLIGDVSPDFPLTFHLGLPLVAKKIFQKLPELSLPSVKPGWHKLFVSGNCSEYEKKSHKDRCYNFCTSPEVTTFRDVGHYRIRYGFITLYIYINPAGYVPEWSHGHDDIGSFVFYWDNRPFLVDCGRHNFQNLPMGLYGRSIRSHNSISIDGFEPYVTHGLNGFAQLMIDDYLLPPPNISLDERNNAVFFKLEYYGFKRIYADLKIRRTFVCKSSRLTIKDEISGSKSHQVETFFHLHPSVSIISKNKDVVRFSLSGGKNIRFIQQSNKGACLESFRGMEDPFIAGWYFPQYGKRIPTHTVLSSQKTELPITNHYVFDSF